MDATKNDPANKLSEFTISRTFDAPRERVWKAWTEVDQMKQWWGPKGSEILDYKMDIRPGGISHYRMRFVGQDMWGKCVYREIVKPERLVWINSFADEKGNTARHPLSPVWPLEMLTTVTLADQGNKTELTVKWVPLNPTEEELRTFEAAHQSMRNGWTGTFDQLTAYLAKQ